MFVLRRLRLPSTTVVCFLGIVGDLIFSFLVTSWLTEFLVKRFPNFPNYVFMALTPIPIFILYAILVCMLVRGIVETDNKNLLNFDALTEHRTTVRPHALHPSPSTTRSR